jgi:hypothetical protein
MKGTLYFFYQWYATLIRCTLRLTTSDEKINNGKQSSEFFFPVRATRVIVWVAARRRAELRNTTTGRRIESSNRRIQAMGRTLREAQQHNTGHFHSHRYGCPILKPQRLSDGEGKRCRLAPHRLPRARRRGKQLQNKRHAPEQSIPFSAFWLRSSVVSVLISLISDMWAMCPLRY